MTCLQNKENSIRLSRSLLKKKFVHVYKSIKGKEIGVLLPCFNNIDNFLFSVIIEFSLRRSIILRLKKNLFNHTTYSGTRVCFRDSIIHEFVLVEEKLKECINFFFIKK